MQAETELKLQVECLGQIRDIIMQHWDQNAGNVHGIKELWAVIHDLGPQEWQAITVCAAEIARAEPGLVTRHSKLWQDLDEIHDRIHLQRPITWPGKREYNRVPFRVLMAMKDIYNDIRHEDPAPDTAWSRLFE